MSLWQKPENDQAAPSPSSSSSTPAAPKASTAPSQHRSGNPAKIGQSIQIKGELTGQEDLIIDGTIDGKVQLKGHHLTIGPNGKINAEVRAKSVQVNGRISGNIHADDKVEISPSGSVLGDIISPRVALADGSSFKGSIDMGGNSGQSGAGSSASLNRDVPIAAGPAKS